MRGLQVRLTFNEWFGTRGEDTAPTGKNHAELLGAAHGAGRLGGGLVLDGEDSRAVLRASPEVGGKPLPQFTLAMWLRSSSSKDSSRMVYSQSGANRGVVLAIDRGRLIAGVWQDERDCWLDLGPAIADKWQHISLVFDGAAGILSGFVDGIQAASATNNLPAQLNATTADAVLGAATTPVRIGSHRISSAGHALIALDEFYLFSRALHPGEIATLGLRLHKGQP